MFLYENGTGGEGTFGGRRGSPPFLIKLISKILIKYDIVMQTRTGKIYGTPSLKERIDMLKIELNKKIEYNLKNGIYGQTAYIDDYALIEYLEEQYKSYTRKQ